ncbi:MAG: dipicolinate synthase subunit B [Oscillospiraceae bacterium]|nr:dipicolinate synthase subunit B [Oscillospiraceae bacterium]
MTDAPIRIGLALTGSYCTFDKALAAAERLAETYDLTAILSERAAATDTRFGAAAAHIARLEAITGKPVLRSIAEAEPIGPEGRFDLLVVAPCTGNTLAKLAAGVTDGAVTMAVKSHLRTGRNVVLAFGSNDGLAASARNLGELLNRKQYYFVPLYQDAPFVKPRSLASDYALLEDTIRAALRGEQIQPILTAPAP